MNKKVYGQILVTAEADEDVINSTEGILFSEFDSLLNQIEEVVTRWNARYSSKLTAKTSEVNEVVIQ